MDRDVHITEKTTVPLFALLTGVPIAVGFIFWLSVIYLKAEAAQNYNEKQDIKIEIQNTLLLDIRDRLIRIEEHEKQRR